MKYAIAMMLLLTSFGAFAAPAVSTLSWDAPTTRVDGTPLQATHGANAGPSCVVAHNSSGFRDRYVAGRLAIA